MEPLYAADMEHPALPPSITVLSGTDVEAEWERFHIFEAMHHRMRICNPMTDEDLDQVVTSLDPVAGDRALDIACGYGELLIRMAERSAMSGIGVDLSPWMLLRAEREAARRGVADRLEWSLGNAHQLPVDPTTDIVTCLGASWIWHGFAGTVRALTARARPGGRIAIGDLRLRDGSDPVAVAAEHGKVITKGEQEAVLAAEGVDVLLSFDASPLSWQAYQDRILESVSAFAHDNPGPQADTYVAEEAQWRLDHERDQRIMTWTVWVGRTQPAR